MTNLDVPITAYTPATSTSSTYTPVAISRDNIKYSRDARTQVVVVNIPAAHPIAQFYASNLPGQPGTLYIYRLQQLDSTMTANTEFYGTIKSVSYSDRNATAQVGVLPVSMALERQIPRFNYGPSCNWLLYSPGCGVSSTAFSYSSTVSSTSETYIVVPGLTATKGDGWAIAGIAIVDGNYRMVIGQSTDTLQLILGFNQNPTGSTITVLAGCSHDLNTCINKFNNGIRFFGFPNLNGVNPFISGIQDNL